MGTKTLNTLEQLIEDYNIQGKVIDFIQCVNGHINDTYHVKIDNGTTEEYIFQRINEYVFKDPIKVMDNIKEIVL